MKRLKIVICLMIVFLFWDLPTVIAQFKEAGVQEFKVPVEAPDFTSKELGGVMADYSSGFFRNSQDP